MFKFNLHEIVKDKVSGFTGVILSRSEYATGCLQYGVAPQKLTKTGEVPEWHWFDETRLQTVGRKIKSMSRIGGPSPQAPTIN